MGSTTVSPQQRKKKASEYQRPQSVILSWSAGLSARFPYLLFWLHLLQRGTVPTLIPGLSLVRSSQGPQGMLANKQDEKKAYTVFGVALLFLNLELEAWSRASLHRLVRHQNTSFKYKTQANQARQERGVQEKLGPPPDQPERRARRHVC